MRVLLTGASGLIGSHLLEHLDGEVYALSRRPGPSTDRVTWLKADLRQPVDSLELPEVDAVVHLAQSPRYREFPAAAEELLQVNVQSTLGLLSFAQKVRAKTFVLASSGGVYGTACDPLTEDCPTAPQDFYQTTKLMAERLVEGYRNSFSTIVLRYFFVYGPTQKDRFLPNLIDRISNRVVVTLAGEEGLKLNPIHVSDAARLTALALQLRGHHCLNIAGSETISLRRLAAMIGQKLKVAPLFDVLAEGSNLIADITRSSRILEPPRIGLEEGLEDLLAGLKQ